jgi:hypothetical protein
VQSDRRFGKNTGEPMKRHCAQAEERVRLVLAGQAGGMFNGADELTEAYLWTS